MATSPAVGVGQIPETQVEEVPKDVEGQDVGKSGFQDFSVEINDSAQGLPYILPDNQLGMEDYVPSPAPTITDEETEQIMETNEDKDLSAKRPVSTPARANQFVEDTSPSAKPIDSPVITATLVDGYHVEASPKTSTPGDSPSDSWIPNGWEHFFGGSILIVYRWFQLSKT